MKKILQIMGIISLMLVIGLAISCGEKKGSPSYVIRQYYTAVEKGGDEETFEKLAAHGEAGMIQMFAQMTKDTIAAKGGIKSIEETIDGDKAIVETTFKDGTSEKLHLVNEDGEWRMTLEK